MRELVAMWRSTRMVVLTAITAALYAAALVAFKFLSILPGSVEVRPGVALVILCSLLFGPAGAWGAAIGNTIGDLVGGLGPGTAVGFVANFLLGLFPYKIARALGADGSRFDDGRGLGVLAVGAVTASAACAATVGAGIQALGLFPAAFRVLGPLIFVPNVIVTLGLCPFLAHAIAPRVEALGLRWQDLLAAPARPPSAWRALAGVAAVLAVAYAAIAGARVGYSGIDLQRGAIDARIATAVFPAIAVAVVMLAIADGGRGRADAGSVE
jgi:energy-coupling factor transport system substrate-specific component